MAVSGHAALNRVSGGGWQYEKLEACTVQLLYSGERQLPTGPGLPPPSSPSLPGMEPDLPAKQTDLVDHLAQH